MFNEELFEKVSHFPLPCLITQSNSHSVEKTLVSNSPETPIAPPCDKCITVNTTEVYKIVVLPNLM